MPCRALLACLAAALLGGCAVVTATVAVTGAVITVGSAAVSTAATVGAAAVKGTVKAGEMVVDAVSSDEAEPPPATPAAPTP